MSDPEQDSDARAEIFEPELPRGEDDLPPLDFSTFIVSLRASAMLHLNEGTDNLDLAMARQEIDLLGIMEEKTRGNLTGDEERLLSQILFDLRTHYLAVSGSRAER